MEESGVKVIPFCPNSADDIHTSHPIASQESSEQEEDWSFTCRAPRSKPSYTASPWGAT